MNHKVATITIIEPDNRCWSNVIVSVILAFIRDIQFNNSFIVFTLYLYISTFATSRRPRLSLCRAKKKYNFFFVATPHASRKLIEMIINQSSGIFFPPIR